MAAASTLARGTAAEDRALAWLEQRGLSPVTRNLRCRFGEIDLVMRDGPALVFVEVRLRRHGNRLSARESIDGRKQRKIATTASWFLGRHPEWRHAPVRFDVVAIDGHAADDAGPLEWIRDAFRP